MKTIVKKTRKFASGIKPNQVYYCIYNNVLSQIRVIKAENNSSCSDDNRFEFEYEVAGVGVVKSSKIPRLYKTQEDAINKKNGTELWRCMCSVFYYCEDKKLLSFKHEWNVMNNHSYICIYYWNGYKVVSAYGFAPCGIRVSVNLLNGDITITCDKGIYMNPTDCENDNKVVCATFDKAC